MSRYCHFCRYCFGDCTKHQTRTGYESEYPDHTCSDFQPDYERSDANSHDDFDRACATCKFYRGYCYISETIRYNDTPVCDRFDIYRNTDW